jgi:hypothetical protein
LLDAGGEGRREWRKKKGGRKGRDTIYRERAPASLALLSIEVSVGGGALLPDKGANSDDALLK